MVTSIGKTGIPKSSETVSYVVEHVHQTGVGAAMYQTCNVFKTLQYEAKVSE